MLSMLSAKPNSPPDVHPAIAGFTQVGHQDRLAIDRFVLVSILIVTTVLSEAIQCCY